MFERTLPVGAAVKRKLNCRVIYDAHEIYEDVAQENQQAKLYARSIHIQYLLFADAFVTINQSIANWYEKNYPLLPSPTIIKNAAEKAPPFQYDGRLHRAAGLTNDARILLYQGGFATKRGLDLIVSAAEFLPSDWALVMMGWGIYEGHLRDLANKVADRTEMLGQKRSVHFLPANYRSLPNVCAHIFSRTLTQIH